MARVGGAVARVGGAVAVVGSVCCVLVAVAPLACKRRGTGNPMTLPAHLPVHLPVHLPLTVILGRGMSVSGARRRGLGVLVPGSMGVGGVRSGPMEGVVRSVVLDGLVDGVVD